ncbi:MAG: NAD-dependent protein deacylase [Dehalococcoidia bacterium]|nr:NAD-dependent protein deacylase [Dehalococcoidia bacterium]
MTTPHATTDIEEAAALLAGARHAVVLAGAGMSKESGIPTFRGEGGLWTTRGEPPLNQYETFAMDPKRWWERRLEQEGSDEFATALDAAQQNAGHVALAELEALGAVAHVISQNIDNLHRRAGQRLLTEIHGNRFWMRCIVCESRWPRAEFPVEPMDLPPRCAQPGCTGIVKGDTVMFGEPIPPAALRRCAEETARADLFLSVGASAVVYPAAQYPIIAAQRGVPLVEVNQEPTPLTPLVAIAIRGSSGDVLPRLVQALRDRRSLPATGTADASS